MYRTVELILLWLRVLAYAKVAESTTSVFILAGQSNMAGMGGVTNNVWDGVVPSACQPNPLILRLNDTLSWEEAREPLHKDGIGPGMPFANSVLKKYPGSIGEIGLVPCAVPGTNISEWKRGSRLYNRMLTRVRAALSNGEQLRALLWYQGESDTGTYSNAVLYKSRLVKFFSDVRSDLQWPHLPIIQVALTSGGSYKETIRKAQLQSGVENVSCVDAKGLALESDGIHLTTPAQVQLGTMMADAFLRMVSSG